MRRQTCVTILVALFYLGSLTNQPLASLDLTQLSLDELMDVQVTSVSKREESLTGAASAIYVITGDDMRRAGVTSIPEALRLAPGVQVARIDSYTWAVSARGFNDRYANKLLVLIDGRSVYTPLFSGVYWDVQDTLLEDVDRIEVIRGPGATLWGANAMNGVINIITKSSAETQGGLITGGGGNYERVMGGVRYGGRLNDVTTFRAYAKYFDRDEFKGRVARTHDKWEALRGGFRLDSQPGEADTFTLQGDIYDLKSHGASTIPPTALPGGLGSGILRVDAQGGNLLGRWTRRYGDDNSLTLQAYYDRTRRELDLLDEVRDIVDLEFHHDFWLHPRHQITWGLGYRLDRDRLDGSPIISFDPENRTNHLFSGFVQDRITLLEERLHLSLGAKVEHNDYTGVEIQPSARMSWLIDERQMLWAAVSRAVRTPSRANHDSTVTFAVMQGEVPMVLVLNGDDRVRSEVQWAYELGYRNRVTDWLHVDLAFFYNEYRRLMTEELDLPPGFGRQGVAANQMILPTRTDNKMTGETYGAELALHWQVRPWWRLSATYSYIDVQLHLDSDSMDVFIGEQNEGQTPHNQFTLRSHMDLPHNLELDLMWYYVDSMPLARLPSYHRFDARIGWHPVPDLELALVGQNLNDPRHQEQLPGLFSHPAEVPRSVFGTVTWRF